MIEREGMKRWRGKGGGREERKIKGRGERRGETGSVRRERRGREKGREKGGEKGGGEIVQKRIVISTRHLMTGLPTLFCR